MISHRNKQSGHAAILFAMMIPLLFGVFILGTDGARALQAKARLEEASEAAVLAVAGQSGSTQAAHDEMATNYIQYYFPFAEMEDITTEDIPCADNSACDTEDDAVNRFYEYTVSATISEPNWFSKDTISTSFWRFYRCRWLFIRTKISVANGRYYISIGFFVLDVTKYRQ